MEELEQNIKMFSDDSLELRDKLKGLGEGAPDHMRETYMLLLKNLAALREEKNIMLLRQGGKTGSIDIDFCIVVLDRPRCVSSRGNVELIESFDTSSPRTLFFRLANFPFFLSALICTSAPLVHRQGGGRYYWRRTVHVLFVARCRLVKNSTANCDGTFLHPATTPCMTPA